MSPRTPKGPTPGADPEQELVALGIERVPVDYFHWNGYRYSSRKDALAAARRARPAGTGDA